VAGFDLVLVGVRALAASAVALLGSGLQVTTRREELELERGRVLAEEALARSELRRVVAERMAEAGSRAARAAHDMSSPLASLRANVDWLREELSRDDLSRANLPEVHEVLDELRTAVDRLAGEVQDLRATVRAARSGGAEDGPAAGERANPRK
jgi:signal transduction histidine kinase